MKGHRKYLGAKFKALKAELDATRKAGKTLRTCNACEFKAAVPEDIDDQITSLRCMVCDHTETQVQIDCPHCSKSIVITNEGFSTCGHCGKRIQPEHVFDALEDHGAAHMAARDGDGGWEPANCGDCEGYHTVVRRGDHYFCTNCFEVSTDVEQCGWCNELNTGDMEPSSWDGCEHCDGQAGWEKDK